jgi:hypothetical protein
MLTSYQLVLNHFLLNSGIGITNVSIDGGLNFYDKHKFSDTMSADPIGTFSSPTYEHISAAQSLFGDGVWIDLDVDSPYFQISNNDLSKYLEGVTKGMLLAILDGDSKRTTSVGIGTTEEKANIFFNTLMRDEYKDQTIKPWSNWNDSVGICTPIFVSRINNVAIVTTSPAHGLNTLFDDWGIIMNLNNGIATSFNISTSTYPNGVPITIVDENTFTYENVGANVEPISVTGTADVKVGWGGTSINLHLYFT